MSSTITKTGKKTGWLVPTIMVLGMVILIACLVLVQGRLDRIDSLEKEIAQAEAEKTALLARIQSAEEKIAQLRQDEMDLITPEPVHIDAFNSSLVSELEGWTDRVDRLAIYLADHAYLATPEMVALEPLEWFNVTRGKSLETEADYRKALVQLRRIARGEVTRGLTNAVRAYQKEHDGQMPADLGELLSRIEDPLTLSVLDRFQIETDANAPEHFLIRDGGMSDPLWDISFEVRHNGTSGTYKSAPDRQMKAAIAQYEADHGQSPVSVSDLEAYLDEVRSYRDGAYASEELLEDLFNAVTTIP